MKRILGVLLSMILILSFAACGSDSKGSGDSSLTIKEGTLMVGMEIGYPPMEYLDADGVTPIGFDVEVAYALGEKLGLEVELVDTAWDGIFSSLDSNRYDCIISSVSINESRQQNYNLTNPYVANKIVIVTMRDSGITSPDDLAGLRVATQTETTADEYVRELQNGGLEIGDYFVYDQVIQCFDELLLGRIDAVVVDSVVATYYIGSDSDKIEVVWESSETEPLGICLKKGNDELMALIEEAIDTLYADGTIGALAEKHFGSNLSEGVR